MATMDKMDYLKRVIVGLWQLAEGHSETPLDGRAVIEGYLDAGFRVFDCADIYTGVERLLGEVIRAHGLEKEVKVHTKYVPDLAALASLTPGDVEAAIDRSRARLGLTRLDLVQFHWWDYAVPGALEALETLARLQAAGKLGAVGLTNFDAAHLRAFLEAGLPIASLQAQFSLLDRRPREELAPLARERGVALLAYGSLAGGLLSARYLGREGPLEPLENRSLRKYLLILDEIGGWTALQALLEVLGEVAAARGSDISPVDVSTVASAYALAQEGVRACIVGVRNTRHLPEHLALEQGFALSAEELARIEAVRARLGEVPGAVFALERDEKSPHRKVMKVNLNKGAG